MLPSIPIPPAQGKSSLAPYKQNMKKSWTSNSRWAQEAEGRVDHKSRFRLQPRSQSVPLSRAYGGMQAQMQLLRQQGGSAMGYGTDDFEEDLDNSTVSHLSHKHDMRAQQRTHEQHIKQSHGQASRLSDYDKKLFSQQTLNEMPWARQQPGRVGIAARMSDKEMERAERRAEMAERKAARKLQHQHQHQHQHPKQQHEMQARGGRSNKPPRNMMVGGHTPEERPWGGLLKKPPRRSLNSEWDATSPNASGMQEVPWDRRAPAGGRGFLGSEGGMGGSAGGGAYMGQRITSQASSGGEDISRRSSAVDMLRLNTGSTAGGGSLQSSPSRSPMVRRGSLGRAPLDPPPPQRPPMWRVNNNGHGANMAAGYASPSVYSAAPSTNVSRHATPRQAARGAGGGSRVGTVGGEDELMEGEARRRLVVEWIVNEFDEIATSNRFHMKQLYQYLSDRNVSFDKAQVKLLVTEVYRRVFILSGWIASIPIASGGQITRALIAQAMKVLVAGGVQVASGPEEEAVVADCLRLLMSRSVQQQAQSGEDEDEEEGEEEKDEDAIQPRPLRGGGMGRGTAAADARDKSRRRATEEEAPSVGRGKVSRTESSERIAGGRSLGAKGGKVTSGRAESKQVSGPKDRAAAAKKVDKAPHAAKAKAGTTRQKAEKPILGAGIRGDGGLESYMAPPGKAESALLQEHMRLMSSLKGAGSTVASSRGTARQWEEEEEEEGEVDRGYDPHLGFDEAALGIDLRGGALAAARSSPIEHKIGTHRSSINLDSINAPSPIGSQNWLPPSQRGAMGGRGDMVGRGVAAGIDASQDVDQMSDLGSGDDEGPAPLDGRYRIYVHANCGESSDTEPVMVYEGPMLGPANDTIALACFDENGTRAHNLVTHQKNGLMHAKSHKGPLTVPLDACQPLRLLDSSPTRRSMGVTLPEGQPIKMFIEAGTSDGQWVDTGAWDGILGVREHSFISPSRITKGQGSFSVMWGLAIEPEHKRHKLVYLCIKSRA